MPFVDAASGQVMDAILAGEFDTPSGVLLLTDRPAGSPIRPEAR